MRFVVALLGALAVTAVIFLFMQGLIEGRQKEDRQLTLHEPIEIYREKPAEQQPERELDKPLQEQPESEPSMEELEFTPLSPQPSVELEIPALELAASDLEVASVGDRWSAPLGSGAEGILVGGGVNAEGFVEVVPNGTRKPNVPELAYKNKINGWVLVAFNVTPEGRTRNIRVLDANPRGVFEDTVVAAVNDWMYRVSFASAYKGDIVLTQKVEVEWKNYPYNMPYLDQ